MLSHVTFGILFVIYGLLKLATFFAIYLIPENVQNYLKTVSGVNLIISGDHTLSGRVVEWVFALFAVFSIVHGVALTGILPKAAGELIESHPFQYSFYFFCGAVLIVFYSLVLYSDAPIPKKKENDDMYWIYGYFVGLSFLIVPIIWQLLIAIYPMPIRSQFVYLTASFLAFFVVAMVMYSFYKARKQKSNSGVLTDNHIG